MADLNCGKQSVISKEVLVKVNCSEEFIESAEFALDMICDRLAIKWRRMVEGEDPDIVYGGNYVDLIKEQIFIPFEPNIASEISNGIYKYASNIELDGCFRLTEDILIVIASLANLLEESKWEFGSDKKRSDIENSSLYSQRLLKKPLIDIYILSLGKLLIKRGKNCILNPWPVNKNFGAILSHDIDLISHGTVNEGITSFLRAVRYRRPSLEPFRLLLRAIRFATQNRSYIKFDEIIELERERGFKSTFFVYAAPNHGFYIDLLYDIRRRPMKTILERMAQAGQDFGLHSSIASVYDCSLLQDERKLLGQVLKKEVLSVRQHELAGSPHERVSSFSGNGFSIDSSIGFNGSMGFRSGVSFPYTPLVAKQKGHGNFLEFPLSLMDNSLFFQDLKSWEFEDVINNALTFINEVKQVHGLVVLNWHPHVFNEALYPGWKEGYIEIMDKLDGGWVSDFRDHASYWLTRRNITSQ